MKNKQVELHVGINIESRKGQGTYKDLGSQRKKPRNAWPALLWAAIKYVTMERTVGRGKALGSSRWGGAEESGKTGTKDGPNTGAERGIKRDR